MQQPSDKAVEALQAMAADIQAASDALAQIPPRRRKPGARPAPTPAEDAPEPTPNDEAPIPTPNLKGKPPRRRGAVTERQIREEATRLTIARHRWPKIGRAEAQRICLVRRDFIEHPYTPRGRVRQEAANGSDE